MTPELLEAARTFATARTDWHARRMTTDDFEMAKSVWACTALHACQLHDATFADADIGAPHLALVSAA